MTNILLVAGGSPQTWPIINYQEIDYFVGIDRGAFYLIEADLPLDLAVGDFDSLTEAEYQTVKDKASERVTVAAEKDETDTQLALKQVFKTFPQAKVTIIGATGGRLDHFLVNLWLPLERQFHPFAEQICLKDKKNSICYLLPGTHEIAKEPDKVYLGYCCLTPVNKLTLTESKYTLKEVTVTTPTSYASNEFLSDHASCSFETGLIAVIQSCD